MQSLFSFNPDHIFLAQIFAPAIGVAIVLLTIAFAQYRASR